MLEILFQYYANIRILLCFFFIFHVIFNNFLTIPVVKEKIEVRLALAIPTGALIILVNEIIDTPVLVTLKIIKILSIQSKVVPYLIFYYIIFFD